MTRTAEEQQKFIEEVTRQFQHISMEDLMPKRVPPPPSFHSASDLSKDDALELLDMSDTVARAIMGQPQATAAVKALCEVALSWSTKNRLIIRPRRSTAFTPSAAPNFVNHFTGDRNRSHHMIELVSPPFDAVPRAFIQAVNQGMLLSTDTPSQVNPIVFIGNRDFAALSPYEKMRTVAAAAAFVARVQREYGRRRSLGLPTAQGHPEHVASLSKFAPQARAAGAEGAGRASVEVFQRYSGL